VENRAQLRKSGRSVKRKRKKKKEKKKEKKREKHETNRGSVRSKILFAIRDSNPIVDGRLHWNVLVVG